MAQQHDGGASPTPWHSIYPTADFPIEEHNDLFEKWHSSFEKFQNSYQSPYFDYYFSGQDINVTIEGLAESDKLPIQSFGWIIEQQKQPVFGFWDYTYSTMLRGTRVVTGAFSMLTNKPHALTSKIAKAAEVRARAARSSRPGARQYHSIRGMTEDEANINEYWYKHYDNNLDTNQQHLFSVHPPFNFIVTYGLQETSLVSNNPNQRVDEWRAKYNDNTPMATDINERLVRNPSVEEDFQILIENVEIVNMSTQYDTEGNPIMETYSFLAKDQRFLSDAVYRNPVALPGSVVRPQPGGVNAPQPV